VLRAEFTEGFVMWIRNARDPANGIGRLIVRVARREASVVRQVDAWTSEEFGLLRKVAVKQRWSRGSQAAWAET
jgi:hypothetical protein